jgi:MYXO-CTERM domain-containing protein
VCWPNGESGGSGCSAGGGAPVAPFAIGLATLGFAISRRRRRV